MTREEARTALSDRNNLLWGMSKEEKKYYSEALDMAISALAENKGDLISRQAVLDLLQMKYSGKELYKVIYELPSVENKGEWIDNGNGSYTCSNCKTEWTTSQIEKMCFCPTCGADMRGE